MENEIVTINDVITIANKILTATRDMPEEDKISEEAFAGMVAGFTKLIGELYELSDYQKLHIN